MFSKNKNSEKKSINKPNNSRANTQLNIISEGTKIEGTIVSKSSLRIDGEVNGKINCEGKLFVAEAAVITGDIHCEQTEICGNVVGNIYSNKLLSIKESAIIKGDIFYEHIEIETGAKLDCNLSQNKANNKPVKIGAESKEP